MRKVLRFMLLLFIPFTFIVGCQDDEADTDFTKEIPLVVRFSEGAESILVDEEQVIGVGLTLSVPQTNPVEVMYEVISNTAIEGQDFFIQSGAGSVVIPAQETEGTIVISLIDGAFDDGNKSFVLRITGVAVNGVTVSPTALSYPTFQVVFAECPQIASNEFVGDYFMELVSPAHGFGPTFDDQVVTMSVVAGTQRSFMAKYLPGLGFTNPPMTVSFDFNCGQTLPFENMESNLFCGGPIFLEPGDEPGSYELGGTDDEFILKVTDLNPAGCGGLPPAYPLTFKFTKQ